MVSFGAVGNVENGVKFIESWHADEANFNDVDQIHLHVDLQHRRVLSFSPLLLSPSPRLRLSHRSFLPRRPTALPQEGPPPPPPPPLPRSRPRRSPHLRFHGLSPPSRLFPMFLPPPLSRQPLSLLQSDPPVPQHRPPPPAASRTHPKTGFSVAIFRM
ncbi:uncharacterized protein LOC108344485 [Vigna angularis]|uniref:uncharacterized protein LOC108344485 n=1 Tax=Phaseolus angularis TaxID=3914 RepID=UPI0022B3CCB6|nr:uncharacterized protein LOC108344485 [Vigna angularis]